jgi:hypothetical protein
MKLFVRTLVVALALTGAYATTHAQAPTAAATASLSKTSAMPIPTCPLDGNTDCGIGDD